MITDWKNEDAKHFEMHAFASLRPLYHWFVKDIEQAIGQTVTGRSVLEIGCGPGFMLEALVKAGATNVTGADLSFSMLNAAVSSGRSRGANLFQADVTSLPLMPGKFDVVFSRGSVFFWPDLKSALSGIARTLCPGGTAIIGGGYGLSTPQQLVDIARNERSSDHGKGIPRIDLEYLLALTQQAGGKAEIKAASGRGFWLFWQPHEQV